MTALSTRPASRVAVGPPPLPETRDEQLTAAAERFAQMDLRDERWVYEEHALDLLLQETVRTSSSPRAAVWQMVIEEPATPLVVKLRTLAAAVGSLAR